PETLKPETLKPETLKPETLKPETLKPETLKPETSKPETFKPETLKPETLNLKPVPLPVSPHPFQFSTLLPPWYCQSVDQEASMTSTIAADDREETIEVSLTGRALIENPLFNKGSAFSAEERREFGLLGLVPPHVSTTEEQLARTYGSYKDKSTDLERYIYLMSLQERNETLFYKLLQEHITEMMPIIYTPVVGDGCKLYSRIYRRPRGLYIPYSGRSDLGAFLKNAPSKDVD